jgi:colicin import membrane protein
MAEQKESSVLFSLKELMNLEEDRIKQEESERKRKEEEALRVKLDAERRAREAEEARMKAAEEERRVGEQRSREEAARLDAIRQAEVEKARLDAENNARHEAMRRQQEHERQLVQMKEQSGKKKLTFWLAGVGAVLLIALVGGGIVIKNSQEQAERATAEKIALEQKITELDAEKKRIQDDISKASGAERDALIAKLQAKEAEIETTKSAPASGGGGAVRRSGGGSKPAAEKPAKPCNCQPGDPLCSCL